MVLSFYLSLSIRFVDVGRYLSPTQFLASKPPQRPFGPTLEDLAKSTQLLVIQLYVYVYILCIHILCIYIYIHCMYMYIVYIHILNIYIYMYIYI